MPTLLRTGVYFTAGLMVLSWVVAASGIAAPRPTALPQPLPRPVVEAWQKAGAQVGWMGLDDFGLPKFRVGELGRVGEVPAFRFPKWQLGIVGLGGGQFGGLQGGIGGFGGQFGNLGGQFGIQGTPAVFLPPPMPEYLPVPDRPFGLDHSNCRLPADWLQEAARFKHLHTLDVDGADVSVTDLAGLTELRVLRVGGAGVTDRGLSHLTRLPHLQVLDVPGDYVTDKGLAALAGHTGRRVVRVRPPQVKVVETTPFFGVAVHDP